MKKLLKFIFVYSIFVLVAPFGYGSKIVSRITGSSMLFDFFAQFFSLWPGFVGTPVRASFYKQTLSQSNMDLYMGFGSFVSKIDARIGKGILINGHSTIGLADIGDGTVIANNVSVLSGSQQHNFTDPSKGILDEEGVFTRIYIGDDVFVGDQSVVMADIGEKTIVAAHSTVVKPMPAYSIVAGSPAKVIKSRRRP